MGDYGDVSVHGESILIMGEGPFSSWDGSASGGGQGLAESPVRVNAVEVQEAMVALPPERWLTRVTATFGLVLFGGDTGGCHFTTRSADNAAAEVTVPSEGPSG